MSDDYYVHPAHKSLPAIYGRLLTKFKEYPFKKGGRIVPFAHVHNVVCATFHTNLDGSYEILYEMEKAGFIEVVNYNGVVVSTNGGRSASSEGGARV